MTKKYARQLLLAQVLRNSCGGSSKPAQDKKKKEHETVPMDNVSPSDVALDDNLDASIHVDENRKKYRNKD